MSTSALVTRDARPGRLRPLRVGIGMLAVASMAGCASMSDEEMTSLLSGLHDALSTAAAARAAQTSAPAPMPTTYTQAWQPPASTYTPSPSYTHVESTASSGSGNQIIQNQRPTPIASTPTTRVTPAKEPARVQVTKVGYYGSTAFNRTESVNEARVYLKNVGSSPAQCFVNGTYSYPSGNGGLASSGDTSSVRLVQGQEQFVRFGMASRNIANFQYTYRCQPI